MLPDTLETLREVVKGGPAWWVYLAFVLMSFLGATLGYQYVGPNERITKVEIINLKQDSILNRDDEKLDAIIALLCFKTSATEHQLARVNCPTGRLP